MGNNSRLNSGDILSAVLMNCQSNVKELIMSARHMPLGKGVRQLGLADQLPDCGVMSNSKRGLYDLIELPQEKVVLDVRCGFGHNRATVEKARGGMWIGVEPSYCFILFHSVGIGR